jgi:hypothetical protein
MYNQGSEPSSPRVQGARPLSPPLSDCPEEHDELGLEELEERLAPGGCSYAPAKKTAGWGC